MKNNRGITITSLIITIIVMVILAGVALGIMLFSSVATLIIYLVAM